MAHAQEAYAKQSAELATVSIALHASKVFHNVCMYISPHLRQFHLRICAQGFAAIQISMHGQVQETILSYILNEENTDPALTPFREQKGEGKLRSQLQTLETDTKSLSIPKRSPSAGILEELQDGKEKEGGADVPALENHVRALQQLVSCAHAREYYMHQLRKHARK